MSPPKGHQCSNLLTSGLQLQLSPHLGHHQCTVLGQEESICRGSKKALSYSNTLCPCESRAGASRTSSQHIPKWIPLRHSCPWTGGRWGGRDASMPLLFSVGNSRVLAPHFVSVSLALCTPRRVGDVRCALQVVEVLAHAHIKINFGRTHVCNQSCWTDACSASCSGQSFCSVVERDQALSGD